MIQNRVKQFIVANFYVPDPTRLEDDTSLIDEAYVDSTGMLEVIAFLEAEFAICVADTEMTPENLETIGRIAGFVARKLEELSDDDTDRVAAAAA